MIWILAIYLIFGGIMALHFYIKNYDFLKKHPGYWLLITAWLTIWPLVLYAYLQSFEHQIVVFHDRLKQVKLKKKFIRY